jgi:hypothetical protein
LRRGAPGAEAVARDARREVGMNALELFCVLFGVSLLGNIGMFAAGNHAARVRDSALELLRDTLDREGGPNADDVREAALTLEMRAPRYAEGQLARNRRRP